MNNLAVAKKFDLVANTVGPKMRNIASDAQFESDPKPDSVVRFDSVFQVIKNRADKNLMGAQLKATSKNRTGMKLQLGCSPSPVYDLAGWIQKTLSLLKKEHPEKVVEDNSNIVFVGFKASVTDEVWVLIVREMVDRMLNSSE